MEPLGALRARVATPADYLFVSTALAERLRRCLALNPTEWYAFSDHSPIVATFEV
jgi:exonuclease III